MSTSANRSEQIEHLYHAARERDPRQRAAFLEGACVGDESVRKEVEALLAQDARVENFLEQPALQAVAKVFAQEIDESWIGRKLGSYDVLSLLGEGGMGQVYLARDTDLGREVALKVLSNTVATEPNYIRFEEEARLASSLNHPNIVTIYSVGKQDVTFIAMEFVRGRTLREMLAGGGIPVRKALDLSFQIVDALAAAHAAGIVHRDLKPENVMVTPDERVKVLDFGLASRGDGFVSNGFSKDDNTAGDRAAAGPILGTVGYMSPEQAMGKAADHTSDQFSFGVILYEMLSGRRAFARATVVETLSAIIREQPPPIQKLNPDVPEPLRQIIERCLAKESAERYVETKELATQLRDLRDRMLAESSNTHSLIQFKRLNRRRAIWAIGIGALGAIAGLAGWELWPRDAGIGSIAVLPFETTTHDEDAESLSVLIAESLIRQIARLRSLRVLPRNAGLTFKGKNVDPIVAGRLLDVDAVVTGTVARRSGKLRITAELISVRGRTVLWGDTYDDDDADLLVIQDRIASQIVNSGIRRQLSREERAQFERRVTSNAEAYALYARALYHQDKEHEEAYLTARGLLEQAVEKDPNFALAYLALARNHIIMAVDGYARPTEMWPQVYRYTRRTLELDPTLLEANSGLAAEAFWYRWDWQGAEREYEIASTSPLTGELMGWVFLRWAVGRYDDALEVIRKARMSDPLSVLWRLREAALLTQSGKLDQGAKLYEEIIHDEPMDARAYFGLAETRRAQNRFDEAIDLIRRGCELDAQDGLLPDPLEEALSAARGIDGYRKVERTLAEIELENLKSRAVDTYVSPVDFARVHARLGNREEAIRYLDAAVQEPSPGVVFLNVDRVWDGIRDDSRFQDAVRRIGLP